MNEQFRELIKKAVDGDKAAIGEIIELKFNDIFYFALSLTNYQDAEDITQNVIIHVYQSIKSLHEIEKFQPWLMGVVYHESLNYIKKARRDKAQLSTDVNEVLDVIENKNREFNPEEFIESEENRKLILQSLKELPKHYETCLTMHYLLGLSRSEIAEILDVNIKKVYNDLHRGRSLLKKIIEKKMGEDITFAVLPVSVIPALVKLLKQDLEDMVSRDTQKNLLKQAEVLIVKNAAAPAANIGIGMTAKIVTCVTFLGITVAGTVLINNQLKPRQKQPDTQVQIETQSETPQTELLIASYATTETEIFPDTETEPAIHTVADMIGKESARLLEDFVSAGGATQAWTDFIAEIGAEQEEIATEPENTYIKYTLEKQNKRLTLAQRISVDDSFEIIYLFGDVQDKPIRMMELILMFE